MTAGLQVGAVLAAVCPRPRSLPRLALPPARRFHLPRPPACGTSGTTNHCGPPRWGSPWAPTLCQPSSCSDSLPRQAAASRRGGPRIAQSLWRACQSSDLVHPVWALAPPCIPATFCPWIRHCGLIWLARGCCLAASRPCHRPLDAARVSHPSPPAAADFAGRRAARRPLPRLTSLGSAFAPPPCALQPPRTACPCWTATVDDGRTPSALPHLTHPLLSPCAAPQPPYPSPAFPAGACAPAPWAPRWG